MSNRLKVLLVIHECNPDWFSVPLVGYSLYKAISQYVDVTLVTHVRNKDALKRTDPDQKIVFIEESAAIQTYAAVVERVCTIRGKVIWPLFNALSYPIYAEFNHRVYRQFRRAVQDDEYDLVHALTPMMPRFPVKLAKACETTPFILGPVNGGVPFPDGFREVARQEFAYFNFLRDVGRFLIPGYKQTYQSADYILVGSSYTLGLIKRLFRLDEDRLELYFENGIKQEFLQNNRDYKEEISKSLNLVFVGRLVPYKGADMVIEAISRVKPDILRNLSLTIVGDGSEKAKLESLAEQLGVASKVEFAGWVPQDQTVQYYKSADAFCFPSVREFGGAVVLEAMASGLPCIVVDNGGIAEYVTAETGFKIEPRSRDYVIDMLVKHISQLAEDVNLRQSMSDAALVHVEKFTWENKAGKLAEVYNAISAR